MPPSADDLITLSRLLDEALDLEPERAEAWLAALPEEHAHLRPKLREMLAAHLANSNPGFMAGGPKLADGPADETVARADELIGPYRLIREIGRGGMGAVWLAERADGTLKRHVALKLPRLAWGAGLAERMARERDIGALLEHPNIARLYDAGVDALGRPYLALEYIAGQPLDAWCEAQRLSVRDRLRLFVQVARAVAYAHGRLVVHRDLKPSNVLVTADGQAHLLDFGIAKLLHEAAPGDDRLTQEQGRVLTPHYASPEQIKGETITVASDVYSLGVLLYELLTGRCPYQPQSKSLAAIEQAILKDEPPPASSQANDKAKARALRGEIDAILAKALRREPGQRYATADALAEDIERHLQGMPVRARPDSSWYRLRKAARRHWIGLSATASVLTAVLVGGAVAILQMRQVAEAAERERVVKAFVADVFRANSRSHVESVLPTPPSPEMMIVNNAKLIQGRFAGQPRLQAELYGMVGGLFSDMGAFRLAADYSAKQVEVLKEMRVDRLVEARAIMTFAQALFDNQRLNDSETQVRRARELAKSDTQLELDALVLLARVQVALGMIDQATASLTELDARLLRSASKPSVAGAWRMALRARILMLQNHLDDGIPLFERAIEVAQQSEGPLSLNAIAMRLMLGIHLAQTTHAETAQRIFDPAIAALRALGGAHEVRAAQSSAYYAWRRYWGGGNGTLAEAMSTLSKSRKLLENAQVPVPDWFIPQIDFWASSMRIESGDIAGGMATLETTSAVLRGALDAPLDYFYLAGAAGNALTYAGRHEQADRWYREELQMQVRMHTETHPFSATVYHHIAENLMMQGRYDEAEKVLDQAPHFEAIRGYGEDVDRYSRFLVETRAQIRLARGDASGALALIERDPPHFEIPSGDDGFDRTRTLLGEVLCAVGRPTEGVVLLKRWLADDEQASSHPNAPWLARLRAVTGLCALQVGDRAFAIRNANLARASFNAQPNVSAYYKEPAERLDRRLGLRSR